MSQCVFFFQMLSKIEVGQLVAYAHLYEDKLPKPTCKAIYENFVWFYGVRRQALLLLGSMVKEARDELKLHQV